MQLSKMGSGDAGWNALAQRAGMFEQSSLDRQYQQFESAQGHA